MNDKIRTLIVDEESTARRGVAILLERDPDIVVVGEASSGKEAVSKIVAEKPDLVFLDVEMPELNGFKVLEAVEGQHSPAVIFVTADGRPAWQAFAANAVDCLLKPFAEARFWAAVRRAKAEIARRQSDALSDKLSPLLKHMQAHKQSDPGAPTPAPAAGPCAPSETIGRDRILLKSGGEIYFLKADEIDWIEAEGDYMKFHAGGRVHLLRETMSNLGSRLDPRRFIRIHRSTIVNIDRVKKLSPSFAGEYAVILHDGANLRLSRGYHDRLQELMRNSL